MKVKKIIVKTWCALIFLSLLSCEKENPVQQENTDLGSAVPLSLAAANTVDTAQVYVWAGDKVAIKQGLFGVNNDWAKVTNTSFSSFSVALDSLGYQLLRFPGGWESEYYDWNTNSTPGWSGTPASPGASIATLKTDVDRYSIVIPTASAMNEELWSTAWWAEIANLKTTAVNAINLAGANAIIAVEIGNEWWLQWGGGVNRDAKLRKYAKTAMNIAEYIDQQFPNRAFKLLINGDYTQPAEFTTLKNAFTKAYDAIDGVALHTYTGYETATHGIDSLRYRIQQCANNFNPVKKYIYLSEWAPSKAYNDGKAYMQAANVIPDIIHEYARAGVDAAAYWPPINASIPGLGLWNYDYRTVFPCGQIFADMARHYYGHAVNTLSDGVRVSASLNDDDTLTLYFTGGKQPATFVDTKIYGFSIDSIYSAVKFRPNDYNQTNQAAPYLTELTTVQVNQATNRVTFEMNTGGAYEIIRVVVKKI